MCRQTTSELIRDILRWERWGQETLATRVGVTQPAVTRWLGGITPRRRNLNKLLELHAQARAHHWASNYFVPVCAWAEAYPPELHKLATKALDKMLGSDPLLGPRKVGADTASPDIYIRPAKLPAFVHAYTFVNDKVAPNVFVILYRKDLSLADRHKAVSIEFYAHVSERLFTDDATQTPARSEQPLSFSKRVIRHYHPKRNHDDEGAEDQS